jgi:hypothetical protein
MIGIDLDNTIIDYSEAFTKAARELQLGRFGNIPGTKHEIRQWLQRQDRNDTWTELQGHVYGAGIMHATPFPGVIEFMKNLHEAGRDFCIISHKTIYPAIGPKTDLRDAAIKWLKAQGFFDPAGVGLNNADVYFHATRIDKVAHIAAVGCKHFIDDLIEVFDEPGFPPGCDEILFDPDNSHEGWLGHQRFRTWPEIQSWILSP